MNRLLQTSSLVALLIASVPAGAAPSAQSRIGDIGESVERLEAQVDDLALDFGSRRGLIGAVEARSRFEEAVYQYLVGEYEPAALSFYTLVESEALTARPLHQDSEWYLAECLFELGNYSIAAEAYQKVVDEGTEHPFFADAVRRQLEVYGLLQDNVRFYDVYQRFIVTGRVQATDVVKYTVAKSLWRQGEVVRARAMFEEVAPSSSSYARARYFLGAIEADAGRFPEALAEFRKAVEGPALTDPAQAEVVELSWLAIGRISYELGDYPTATQAYQKISSDSASFSDQLYELVWTFIKQERWSEALEYLSIFLVGFPSHPEAVNLKLTQGHVFMKEDQRAQALVAYEQVVADYTPVQATLRDLEENRADPARYFRLLAGKRGTPSPEDDALPEFAREVLIDDVHVARAVEIYRSMDDQAEALEHSQQLIDQVTDVLRRTDRNIGTFARGRARVRSLRDESLAMQAALVDFEIDLLLARAGNENKPALLDLKRRFEVLQGRKAEVEDESRDDQGRMLALGQQLGAVQELARRVEGAAAEQQAQARGLSSLAAQNPTGLPPAELSVVQDELARVTRDLEQDVSALQRLSSDSTRSSLMAMAAGRGVDPGDRARAQVGRDYASLRTELRRFRAALDGDDGALVRSDELWARCADLDRRAAEILGRLDRAEQTELAVLRSRLGEQTGAVAQARDDLRSIQEEAGEIATDVALVSFRRLEGEVGQTIMEADLGIVDIYWLDKTESSDEIESLGKDRAAAIQTLDDRFQVVHQKLEGQVERSPEGN